MKRESNRFFKRGLFALGLVLTSLSAVTVWADTVTYVSPKHVFSIDDVQCDDSGTRYGRDCLSPTEIRNEKDGQYYYGIDAPYAYDVKDFDPSVSEYPRPADGVYNEGFVRNLTDDSGNVVGLKAATPPTPKWKAGALSGEWIAGMGGNSVKAATEHYRVMDHVLNADWMGPLVEATYDPVTGEINNVADFATSFKDDGKILFYWGNLAKSSGQVRLYTAIPVPAAWKEPGADYTVKSAKLILKHTITNSPNDQIRPEDFENENATGILPQYVVEEDGTWVSAVDAVEGDGDVIPAGTVLRTTYPDIYPDTEHYFTNAWYTSLDRDPFGGPNPRYRLKSSKYGQDLPGVEIPQYKVGSLTTTTLDLMSIVDEAGNSILGQSANWNDYLDIDPEKGEFVDNGLTVEGCRLTADLDLSIYVKGEQKGVEIYDAQLIVEYDDPDATVPPVTESDVVLDRLDVTRTKAMGRSGEVAVTLHNDMIGAASGVLNVEIVDAAGAVIQQLSEDFITMPDSSESTLSLKWTVPKKRPTVTVSATAVVDNDMDTSNNSLVLTTQVY